METALQDTAIPPVDPGQEVAAPAVEVEVEAPQTPEVPVEEPQAPQIDPSEALVDKAFQKASSWWGRREKELRDEFQGQLGQVLEVVKQVAPQADPIDPTTQLLNDPQGFITNVLSGMQQRENQNTQAFVKSAARIMDTDPDFADQKLGEEVVAQIGTLMSQRNPNIPPDVAAELIVAKAKANVLAGKFKAPKNPLSNNKPATAPLGGVKPGSAPSPAKPKANVSDDVLAYGRKLGLSDEEIEAEFM